MVMNMNVKNATGNTKIREDHKREILNHIRKSGPVSRTEIYEKTNISKPTVTRVIEELIKEGIIKETGVGESLVGRRPVNIELNPDACYCIGVNISRNSINASVVNIGMNVVLSKSASIKGINSVSVFEDTVLQIVRNLIKESGIDREKILGIGIGVPGIVDYREGVILDFALVHNLTDVHLGEYLQGKLGLRVFIDNNANTRALGEYWYGYGAGFNSIIFVICSEGVGSGIITDGMLLRSNNNVISGLGHMTVNVDGRKCSCGKYGCIEAYCSTEAVERITGEALKRGRESMLMEKVDKGIEAIDYRTICKSAGEGDPLCIERLDETAFILSTGLSNLIGIFNPEIIILSGNLFDASDYFYKSVVEMTRQKLFKPLFKNIAFRKRNVKDSLYEIGAATMVLKDFFKD